MAALLRKHQRSKDCPLVFPSPFSPGELSSPSFLHDLCKNVAKRAKLDFAAWHLHRFRDTAATRWLRAGIDVRRCRPGSATNRSQRRRNIWSPRRKRKSSSRRCGCRSEKHTRQRRKPSELPLSSVFYTDSLQIIHVPRGLNLLPRKRVLWISLMEYQSFISDSLHLLANPNYRRTHQAM